MSTRFFFVSFFSSTYLYHATEERGRRDEDRRLAIRYVLIPIGDTGNRVIVPVCIPVVLFRGQAEFLSASFEFRGW